jgi:flagellar protein FliS
MNAQQSYREAAVRGASPVELVVRLYEQMIEDMRQVSAAIEKNDIMLRTNRVNHVILVIGHLQSSLDSTKGDKVARDLNGFYNTLRQNVVWVQFHPSKVSVAQVITDLLVVREAWIQVERDENPSSTSAARLGASGGADPESNPSQDAAPDAVRPDWNG